MTTATANATALYPTPDIDAAVARAFGPPHATAPTPYSTPAAPRRSTPAWPRISAPAPGNIWDKGDLAQASNKAWGLVAETVKAISAHHGRIIHTHRAIWQVVGELAQLVGDAGDMETRRWINNSFRVARSLHFNFYEDRDRSMTSWTG